MEKKKLYIILGSSIFLFIAIFFIFINIKGNTSNEVEIITSTLEKQSLIDETLETEGYTFDEPNIMLNPYEISPLTALIMFETEDDVAPKVTIKGKDEHSTFTHTFNEDTVHYLNIYGLYPDTENEVIVEIDGTKKTFIIETDPLPDDFIMPTDVYADKSELDNELYFFTPALPGPTTAYDVNGDVRWYLDTIAVWKIDRLNNGRLLLSTERPINPPYYNTGLVEIDLLGKIYTEFNLPGGYHHDYFELENGNLIVATDDFDTNTVEDVIVELDRETGVIVKKIDLKDILKTTDGKSEDWIDYDWFHNNSTWYDAETDSLILSGRHQDAVISLDYSDETLNWIIGDSTGWSDEYQKYFFTPTHDDFEWQWAQHAAMITPEGYVFILDNGNNKSKIEEEYVPAEDSYTRGIMYSINTENMTIKEVWEYGKDRGSEFYSPYISDVDYINENHYIVHSGGVVYVDGEVQNSPAGLLEADELKSFTVEIKDNKKIFEIELPTNKYRVEKMDMYSDHEFELTEGVYKGTLGETKKDDTSINLFPFITDKTDEYDYTFTKEVDRLVFEGTFKQNTEIDIILAKGFTANYYNIRVSKTPYTALCVDIFTEEETENGITINKYINDVGLKGKYNIYIKINGTIYNTDEYVEF